MSAKLIVACLLCALFVVLGFIGSYLGLPIAPGFLVVGACFSFLVLYRLLDFTFASLP